MKVAGSEVLYRDVYTYESNCTFGVKVLIAGVDREFSSEEKFVLYKAVEEILEATQKESLRLDPKTAEYAASEKAQILNLFPTVIYAEEIPNQYCSRYCCSFKPWFIVTTPKGRIKIGWRKRVIVIDWSDSTIKHDGKLIFAKEDVTVGDRYVHAWGYEKARVYLNQLLTEEPA